MSFRGGKASLFFYSMIYVHVSNISPYNYRWTSDALTSIIQVQCFAMAHAKLCDDTCKALRWHLQSFALSIAIVLPEVVQFLKMYMPSIYIYSS